MNFQHMSKVGALLSLFAGACVGEGIEGEDIENQAEQAVIEVVDEIGVATPEAGMSVTMEILYEDGNMELVTTTIGEGGEVTVHHHDDFGLIAPPLAGACAAKCTDTSKSLLGYEWNKKYSWRYRDGGRPASVTQANAIAAFQYAFNGIQSSRNSCSLADQVEATHEYLGTTSTAPNISSSGCLQPDGKNVVGWGSLPAGVLGLTCTWFTAGGEAIESDQRYNSSVSWFAGNSVPANCSNKYSLRAVATHEAGHAFGLNHTGCSQTMAPSVKPCNSAARSFGKGDVLGLRTLY